MISSSLFDPFNHGTSSIKFRRVSKNLSQKISALIKESWKITKISKIEEHDVKPKVNSNNFRITAGSGTFLLKASHLNNSKKQELINDCILYCEKKNIPAPHIIFTKSKQSYVKTTAGLYCLYDFIDGEHFDGSKRELVNAAAEVAKLIKVLETIPYQDKIKNISRFSYHHPGLLRKAIIMALKSRSKSTVDKLVKKHYQEILKSSQMVSKSLNNLKTLPCQVVHGDLHPHNMMFEPKSKKLLTFLDFDTLEYTPRVRSVAHAMHRLARTYGERTERKTEIGQNIQSRLKLFLKSYLNYGSLTPQEIKLASLVLQDRELKGIMIILKSHYMERNPEWDFDLEKRITTLSEAVAFL